MTHTPLELSQLRRAAIEMLAETPARIVHAGFSDVFSLTRCEKIRGLYLQKKRAANGRESRLIQARINAYADSV